jgi:Zn-dependent peptidase ImmA (M78 family)
VRRGFKTEAEKRAADARRVLKVGLIAPLDPWAYASHVGVIVLDFGALGLSSASVRQLTINDDKSWSAMTIKEGGTLGLVLNPAHAQTRQRNDLMHELAHVELKHTPARVEVSKTGLLLLSDYSEDQEQEADWYAGAMLLPRAGLMHHRLRSKDAREIAEHYGVSPQLCEWRLRMTGVEVQMRRSHAL